MMTSQILKSAGFTKTQKSWYLKNETLFFLQIKKFINYTLRKLQNVRQIAHLKQQHSLSFTFRKTQRSYTIMFICYFIDSVVKIVLWQAATRGVLYKKVFLKFTKFLVHVKDKSCNKVCNFIKKRLQHECFPVNIPEFLEQLFLNINYSGCFWIVF